MIARTISVHEQLGFKRQVFYVNFYGWDHHDEVLQNQVDMFNNPNNIRVTAIHDKYRLMYYQY